MTGNSMGAGHASEEELSRWMQSYGSMLVGTCTALLGDVHQAQDIVQETFIRAYQNRQRFRGGYENSEKAWLTRIAINLCRDQQRSKWFRWVDQRVPIEERTLAMSEADEEARELYAAVQALPAKYREAVLLSFYQNMAADEIARVLHLSVSSVYRRINKAVQLLRKTLERWDFRG